MMQGLWKVRGRDSITLAISGDSAMEYILGNTEMAIFDFTLSKEPCDNEDVVKGSTGLYFTLGDEEDDPFCAALEYVNGREFKLVLDADSMLIFEKIL